MKIKLFFFVFLITCHLLSHDIDHEIYVPLSKAESIQKVYVYCNDSDLKKVLLFDLKTSGVFLPVSEAEEEEKKIVKDSFFAASFWKEKGYSYVLKVMKEEKTLFGTLYSLKTGSKISLPSSHLSGSLRADRRLIHQLSDFLYEESVGEKGIAQTQIYFAIQLRDIEGWKSEIWSADYDGYNTRQITEENSYCIHPTLFPIEDTFTKNKYLYVNYKLGQPKIFISSLNQKKGSPFLSLRGNQLLPSFSKDGQMLAFISDASGQADLFVHAFCPKNGLIGKPMQLYSFPSSVQASPTFRPDGKKIAFVSDHEGTARIYLISLPSLKNWKRPHPICLTQKYRENTCPAWSPDGTKLAYSAKINGVRQIMVYDFLTKEEVQLTTGKYHKENPSWAPNSTHIIFNTADPSSSELFLINLKQKEMVQITEGPGKKHYPTWGH